LIGFDAKTGPGGGAAEGRQEGGDTGEIDRGWRDVCAALSAWLDTRDLACGTTRADWR
jgi:hypothetical protein